MTLHRDCCESFLAASDLELDEGDVATIESVDREVELFPE